MAKKANLKDPLGNILYPYTLVDSVRDEAGRVLSSLVLRKDNTTEFTPSADYHPSTKKYVDETAAAKQPKITSSGILMGNGSGGVSAATANTDYIYITTNKINGKKYIGQRHGFHANPDDDVYLGSGTAFIRAVKKYGRENFQKEIIEYCDSQTELDKAEKKWISFYQANTNKGFYNIACGGQFGDT